MTGFWHPRATLAFQKSLPRAFGVVRRALVGLAPNRARMRSQLLRATSNARAPQAYFLM